MPKPDPRKEAVGRTWPDVAVEVLRLVGLPIVVIGGVLFAFYSFYQLIATNAHDEDLSLQSQLKESREALMDTLRASHELQGTQIKNIQDALNLQTQLAAQTSEKQKKIQDLELDSSNFLRDRDEANRQANDARAELQAATIELNKEIDEKRLALTDTQKSLEKATQQLNEQQQSITNRASSIEALRADVALLSEALLLPASPNHDRAVDLAKARLANADLPFKALSTFASQGELSPLERESLIGLPVTALKQYIQTSPDYASWIEDDQNHIFLGIAKIESDSYSNVIEIATDGAITIDLATADIVAGIALPNSQNYYDTMMLMVAKSDHAWWYSYKDNLDSVPTTWTMEDYLAGREELDSAAMLDVSGERKPAHFAIIAGNDKAVQIAELENFTKDVAVDATDSGGSLVDASTPDREIQTFARSKNFALDLALCAPIKGLTPAEDELLWNSFARLLAAVVKGRYDSTVPEAESALSSVLSNHHSDVGSAIDQLLFGRIAAITGERLADDNYVIRIRLDDDKETRGEISVGARFDSTQGIIELRVPQFAEIAQMKQSVVAQ